MSTSERRSFVVESERVARCDRRVVMGYLLDATSWPRWQREIVATRGSRKVKTGDVVRGHAELLGFGVAGHAAMEEVRPHSMTEDVLVGVRMRVSYEVDDDDGSGCIVRAKIVTEAPTGVAGRVLGFLLRYRLRRMQRASLKLLARLSEDERGDRREP